MLFRNPDVAHNQGQGPRAPNAQSTFLEAFILIVVKLVEGGLEQSTFPFLKPALRESLSRMVAALSLSRRDQPFQPELPVDPLCKLKGGNKSGANVAKPQPPACKDRSHSVSVSRFTWCMFCNWLMQLDRGRSWVWILDPSESDGTRFARVRIHRCESFCQEFFEAEEDHVTHPVSLTRPQRKCLQASGVRGDRGEALWSRRVQRNAAKRRILMSLCLIAPLLRAVLDQLSNPNPISPSFLLFSDTLFSPVRSPCLSLPFLDSPYPRDRETLFRIRDFRFLAIPSVPLRSAAFRPLVTLIIDVSTRRSQQPHFISITHHIDKDTPRT